MSSRGYSQPAKREPSIKSKLNKELLERNKAVDSNRPTLIDKEATEYYPMPAVKGLKAEAAPVKKNRPFQALRNFHAQASQAESQYWRAQQKQAQGHPVVQEVALECVGQASSEQQSPFRADVDGNDGSGSGWKDEEAQVVKRQLSEIKQIQKRQREATLLHRQRIKEALQAIEDQLERAEEETSQKLLNIALLVSQKQRGQQSQQQNHSAKTTTVASQCGLSQPQAQAAPQNVFKDRSEASSPSWDKKNRGNLFINTSHQPIPPSTSSKELETPRIHSMLTSTILRFAKLPSFMTKTIEAKTARRIQSIDLLFRNDMHCSNMGPYLSQGSFPLLVLLQSKAPAQFGVFSAGFKSQASPPTPSQHEKGAVLFNITDKKCFSGRKWDRPVVEYAQNVLTVGNGEVVLRNKDLGRVRIGLGSIMGPQCFKDVQKWQLSGESETQVKLQGVEIHQVVFQGANVE